MKDDAGCKMQEAGYVCSSPRRGDGERPRDEGWEQATCAQVPVAGTGLAQIALADEGWEQMRRRRDA